MLEDLHLATEKLDFGTHMTTENLALRQQLASSDGGGIIAASICGMNLPTDGFSIPNRAKEGTCQVNGRG